MDKAQNHPEILEKVKNTPLLCVGDVMLDRYVYGTVDRLSPEAPVPVLLENRVVETAGGAGNVAVNLKALGCAVRLVAVAGADAAAEILDQTLAGIDTTLVIDDTRPTISKTRYCVGPQQMLRVDAEKAKPLAPDVEAALLKAALEALAGAKALLLSDYGKGTLTPHVLKTLIGAAQKAGIPVVVDPKGRDYARYKGATVITPNRKELAEATGGMPTATDADIEAAAKSLLGTAGVGAVVATRSEKGMSVIDGTGATHIPTRARDVFDVSGAGDTVAATLAAALAVGANLVTAADMANTAAGLVVEKVGTASVSIDELVAALGQGAGAPKAAGRTLAPVYSWQEARDQVERWRAQGLSVGFTNGCFDILHQGHVMMLDRCRGHCDKLVLGLNTDASISRLKGPTRPVNPASARAAVIAALGSIDAVVMFGDDVAEGDTPLELMKTLRPDVIFKGQDYTVDKVIGADFVQSYGGRVVLVSLEDGFSTTGTIKKLQDAA